MGGGKCIMIALIKADRYLSYLIDIPQLDRRDVHSKLSTSIHSLEPRALNPWKFI